MRDSHLLFVIFKFVFVVSRVFIYVHLLYRKLNMRNKFSKIEAIREGERGSADEKSTSGDRSEDLCAKKNATNLFKLNE